MEAKSDQSAIFNIFHDGTFLSLKREANDIHFQIEIQYLAEMVDPAYCDFTGVFKNCQQFLLRFWEEEEKYSEDIDIISTFLMDMEISRSSFEDMQVFVYCLSEGGKQAGASLIFSCECVLIFDEGQREVTIDELQNIAHHYWNHL